MIRLCFVLAFLPVSQPAFQLQIAYYSLPVYAREWTISLHRSGADQHLAVRNFRGIKRDILLDRDRYTQLLDKLNRLGIWRLKDLRDESISSDYYIVEIRSETHQHQFHIDRILAETGAQSQYREIIRLLTNTARMLGSD